MHLTVLLVLVAAAAYGDPTTESQTPPGGVKKPGRSGRDLWRLPRTLLRAIHSDSRPSRDSVYQWFNPKAGLNSAVIAGMRITASIPSVNLDNIPDVSSITCKDDKVTMVVSSIADLADWELQKILLLIDSRHRCQKEKMAKFVMLVATSWTIDTTTGTVVFDTKDPQAEGVTGTYVIVANPGTGLPKPVNPTSSVTNLEKRDDTDKTSALPVLFDKTMKVPLIVNTSTNQSILFGSVGSDNTLKLGCNPCSIKGETTIFFKAKGVLFQAPQISVTWEGDLDITAMLSLKAQADISLKSSNFTLFESPFNSIYIPGILNLGPSVKLVTSAHVSLTAAISAELEILAKMPKFFTKLSSTRKVAQYLIDPQYSVSASATASVNGTAKVIIEPQLALSVHVFGMSIPKASIEMQVALFMDLSVRGKFQKKISSKGASDEKAAFTALASIDIRASVSASLFGACFSLYTSPISKVFTKEYKTLEFGKPPAEVDSIESAIKLSAKAIKHAIGQPLIGANPQTTEQATLPETKRPIIVANTQSTVPKTKRPFIERHTQV
ncbi:hypothetical protein BASA50_001006 [Batrachochytrium salamandrivorans]|uniref:DUF7223 domain-containing protein n=1 Tax=Batrachochytrium salamandrivorans TaxID=1357716 RepID=A0ABQ8EUZ2_9FUNG|nr:hypothetical protein BASA62_009485 [Batrachochytrium salamandrivorans]KAH6577699.1 hypothetical protein BASA60_003896 [Batrachochytrium salamandrivorans]KAH6585672.1 hypothetical protein BASA50_001006 [Batrachochytrium salamandrivorans]KAH6592575.1 hypothetical protein BASA61_004511 [Batrachochytrium salamandrivorans]KAH9248991.1 hypothetical protein BASA81_013335 [Batrachochytrium salamandrivorans]